MNIIPIVVLISFSTESTFGLHCYFCGINAGGPASVVLPCVSTGENDKHECDPKDSVPGDTWGCYKGPDSEGTEMRRCYTKDICDDMEKQHGKAKATCCWTELCNGNPGAGGGSGGSGGSSAPGASGGSSEAGASGGSSGSGGSGTTKEGDSKTDSSSGERTHVKFVTIGLLILSVVITKLYL